MNGNTKRNKSPRSYPTTEEKNEMAEMMKRYQKPMIFSRMKPLEAPPFEGKPHKTKRRKKMYRWGKNRMCTSTTPPMTPELDPTEYWKIGVTNCDMDESSTLRTLFDQRK